VFETRDSERFLRVGLPPPPGDSSPSHTFRARREGYGRLKVFASF
jgi:hypothetical protein